MSIRIKNATIVVLIIIIFLLSFLLFNRDESTVNRIVEIKWQKGDIIRDTIECPVPVEVKTYDSMLVPTFISTDTAALFAIWQEYYLERQYNLDFSNDSVGTFKVDAVVNQNKLISATSFIQPKVRTIREREFIYKTKKVVPWVMVGTSVDLNVNKIQFGIDLGSKYAIGVSGIRTSSDWGYTLDFGIKF